jgi:hypothetical protein
VPPLTHPPDRQGRICSRWPRSRCALVTHSAGVCGADFPLNPWLPGSLTFSIGSRTTQAHTPKGKNHRLNSRGHWRTPPPPQPLLRHRNSKNRLSFFLSFFSLLHCSTAAPRGPRSSKPQDSLRAHKPHFGIRDSDSDSDSLQLLRDPSHFCSCGPRFSLNACVRACVRA